MKQKKYRINSNMIAQKIQGKEVIFDSEASIVYTLNETATFILNEIKLKKNEDEIAKCITKLYDIEPGKALIDIQETVQDLITKKILVSS